MDVDAGAGGGERRCAVVILTMLLTTRDGDGSCLFSLSVRGSIMVSGEKVCRVSLLVMFSECVLSVITKQITRAGGAPSGKHPNYYRSILMRR